MRNGNDAFVQSSTLDEIIQRARFVSSFRLAKRNVSAPVIFSNSHHSAW
jgi:hypothetical protein